MKIENHAVQSQKYGSEVKLKRNLSLEKVVSTKQLRLTVATDRRRKKNKSGKLF